MAEWIDSESGNRRSWLFYIFCVISALSSLSINGKEMNISVNQYFRQPHDTEKIYSAIIIVKQQKIEIRKHDRCRSDILCSNVNFPEAKIKDTLGDRRYHF